MVADQGPIASEVEPLPDGEPREQNGGHKANLTFFDRRMLDMSRMPDSSLRARARGAAGRVRDRVAQRRAAWGAPDPPAVLTDARGLRFELITTEEIEHFRRHNGHFETAELDFLARRTISGVAVDVGANIGVFSALLARSLGPDGHLHAFEPLPATVRRLRRTLDLNGLDNVTVHSEALSDAIGVAELALYGPGFESWSSLTRQEIDLSTHRMEPDQRIEVPTGTLDAFCTAEGIDRLSVVKIDVEGAEGRVLRGAHDLLAAHRIDLLLLELSDNTLSSDGWSSRAVIELLDGHGYDTWTIVEGELRPFRTAGPVAFANLVATPRAA
jgi:FkbM family methyltransferase